MIQLLLRWYCCCLCILYNCSWLVTEMTGLSVPSVSSLSHLPITFCTASATRQILLTYCLCSFTTGSVSVERVFNYTQCWMSVPLLLKINIMQRKTDAVISDHNQETSSMFFSDWCCFCWLKLRCIFMHVHKAHVGDWIQYAEWQC